MIILEVMRKRGPSSYHKSHTKQVATVRRRKPLWYHNASVSSPHPIIDKSAVFLFAGHTVSAAEGLVNKHYPSISFLPIWCLLLVAFHPRMLGLSKGN